MLVHVHQLDAQRFLGRCRSLFEEMKIRCEVGPSDEYVLRPRCVPGLAYQVSPLRVFGTYGPSSRPALSIVLNEWYVERTGEGMSHIGLVAPAPPREDYDLETLEYDSLLYIKLSVMPQRGDKLKVDANSNYHRYTGMSLLEGRDFQDVIRFVEDRMFDEVGRFSLKSVS